MDVRLLGPVDVEVDRQILPLGGPKQRAVLSLLALNANATVSVDALIEGLWGERHPASAAKNIQLYVSQLRKLLGGDGGQEIVTRGRGYELRIDPEAVDALRFERLVGEASRAGGGDAGTEAAHEALALWRGAPFADLAGEPFADIEARRLEDLYLVALELATEGDLDAGRHMELIGRLEALVAEHPLRERLHGQLMLALYRSGRQAEALEAYRAARESLVDQIGVEPGPDLRRLHEAILHQDPELELRPLDAESVREVARLYLGERADEAPVELLLEESGGLRPRVHEAVAEWARRGTAARVGERAGDTETRRGQLRELEAELAAGVEELGAVQETAELYSRPADVGGAGVPVCPFKGLASFDVGDAGFFFGRERQVAEIVARLVGTNLLGIVGASGSGKSSALRAGLLPALAGGVLPGSEGWNQALLRPGEHPPAALRGALEAAGASEDRLVIAVDQFEEVFTACRDERERATFVDALVAAAKRPDGRVVVVIAMRADYYGACATYPELSRMLGAGHVLVGPMRADELARAIEAPARRAGLAVEPELVTRLVEDVAGQPGGLPLLSTALLELWEHREGRRLTLASYEATGGVDGAVARLAERAYGSLTADEQDTARRALMRLAGEGEGHAVVRRRVPLAELGAGDDRAARVLGVLADRRLVTVGEDSAEVAHEALLREWPRLRAWLEEDAEGRRLHRHVSDAARDWEADGRDASELYRGARLAAALDWAAERAGELNPLEREFLEESRAASEREAERGRRVNRRLRTLLAGAAVALAVAVAAGVLALDQRGDARGAAVTADAQRLGALALNDERLDQAVLLARAGVDLEESATTRGALLSVLLRSPAALGVLNGEGWPLYSIAASPDGRLIATGDERGGVEVFDAATRRSLGEPYRLGTRAADLAAQRDGFAERVRFSPDGRTLAVIGHAPQGEPPGGLVELIDPRTRERRVHVELPGLEGSEYVFSDVAFLPGGDVLVMQGTIEAPDGPAPVLRRVDGDTGAVVGRPLRVGDGGAVGLSTGADPNRAYVTSGRDGRGSTYEIDTRRLRVVRVHPAGDYAGAISRDGRLFALGSEDGRVRVLDLRSDRVRALAGSAGGKVLNMQFTPDARRLVTVGENGAVVVWDVAGGRIAEELPKHGDEAFGLDISRDGRTLYTASVDSRALIWDLGGDRRLARRFEAGRPFGEFDTPRGLAASPDGRTLAVGQADGTVTLVDTRTLAVRETVRALRGFVAGVAFSRDGRRLAASGAEGEVTLWDARTLRRDGAPLEGMRGQVQGVAFSPEGRLLAASDSDFGPVRVWNLRRRVLTRVRIPVVSASIAFSPDGRLLAAAGIEDPSEVRDVRSGMLVARVRTADFGRSVAWSPDGRLFATGQYDGRIQLWSTASWRRVGRPLEGHTARVTGLEFVGRGRMLASAGADGAVMLWDVASQKPVGSGLTVDANRFMAAAVSPRGTHLFTASDGIRAMRLDLRAEAWKRQACLVAGRKLGAREWSDVLPERPYRPVCGAG